MNVWICEIELYICYVNNDKQTHNDMTFTTPTTTTFDNVCNITNLSPRDMSIVRIHSMKGNCAIQVNGYLLDFQEGYFSQCTIVSL